MVAEHNDVLEAARARAHRASCARRSSRSCSGSARPPSRATATPASTSSAWPPLTQQLALALGLPEDEAELIGHASAMHDVGKIGIPDRVLLKPGAPRRRRVGA